MLESTTEPELKSLAPDSPRAMRRACSGYHFAFLRLGLHALTPSAICCNASLTSEKEEVELILRQHHTGLCHTFCSYLPSEGWARGSELR